MTNHESWPNPATCEVNDNKHILILKKYLKIIKKGTITIIKALIREITTIPWIIVSAWNKNG